MEKQNITLSLPKNVLQRAKIIAIKRNNSLSGMLTEMLAAMVEDEDRYDEAMRRSLRQMENARALAFNPAWARDALHER